MRTHRRGYSILAALVFVGILGGVATIVHLTAPPSSLAVVRTSQTAAPPAAAPAAPAPSEDPCAKAKKAAISNAGRSPEVQQKFQGQKDPILEQNKCVAAVLDQAKVAQLKAKGVQNPQLREDAYKCVGETTKVYMDKTGQGTIISRPGESVEQGKCSTQFCDASGLNCTTAKLKDGKQDLKGWTVDKEVMKEFTADQFQGASKLGPLDDAQQKALNDAFKTNTDQLQQQVDTKKSSIDEIQKQIEQCNVAGCDNLSELTNKKDALQKELEADSKRLAEMQKAELTPPAEPITSETTKVDVKCEGGKCYANTTDPREVEYLKSEGFKCTTTGDTYACSKANSNQTFPGPAPIPRPDPRKVSNDPNAQTGPGSGPGSGGNPLGSLGNLLSGLMKGLGSALGSGSGAACSSDPNAYAQQQQQYQQQMQQYNYQLQQYNYQQQMSYYYGGTMPTPPTPPSGCTPNSQQNTCPAAPAQPTSGCANGTYQPIKSTLSNGYSCTTGWQCVPTNAVQPSAQLSCQPKIADVGMSVAISFACTNATGSSGAGFDTGNQTSGSTTTVVAAPPANTNAFNYVLTCTNQSLVARAECGVQISRPSIILVANPKIVQSGGSSTIGWVTTGMNSCVISSPQLPDFTAQNASNTSPNGMATTSALTQDSNFILNCITAASSTRAASTTVQIATSTSSN